MKYTKRFDEVGKGDIALAGGKGANLGEMSRAGLPVPAGFLLTTAAYDAFVESNGFRDAIVKLASMPRAEQPSAFEQVSQRVGALFCGGEVPEEMAEELRAAYEELDPDRETAVAVRSSATAEDLAGASFAGQQETFLNVRGTEALADAVKRCWASLWTARAMAYRERQGIVPEIVSLAVVVQEMVEAEAAGVMFTANPSNGRRDQATISAAWGLGESVVSGQVSTDDLVVEKDSGRVISRDTADKTVMTVYTDSGTEEWPVPEARRRAEVLTDAQAAELARLGARIEEHYGSPQDIEWALSGGDFSIVQSRPITVLPELTADAPTDWSVPHPDGLYFRASIVEQMPDPLTPLFADMSDGSVAHSLMALMKQVFGGVLNEGDIAFPTVNGYAYYYYRNSAFWRMVFGTPAAIRTLSGRSGRPDSEKFRGGPAGWRERSHPKYVEIVNGWNERNPRDLASEELLNGVSTLLDAGTEYYTAVQSIIPLAASSEIIFSAYYERLVRREGDPAAQTFVLGFDSMPIRAERSLYDLAMWTREHPDLATQLQATPSERALDLLHAEEPLSGVDRDAWRDWRSRFDAHLDRYGHTVYNLDFVNPVPADDPVPLFDTLKFYLRGEGQNPYERQRRAAERREEATQEMISRLDPARRAVFRRLLEWSQDTGPIREDALADMGLAWVPMRKMLLELGRRLTEAEVIAKSSDVFWLRHGELQQAAADLDAGKTRLGGLTDEVEQRKMLWRGQKRANPPQMLPEDSWINSRAFEAFMPAASGEQTGDIIRGVGASSGSITAPARVLSGPEDFRQMRPGEVLVAGITTPAWTSLFAMASAVVTDVGGPLSHGSIVAREYGIPAVLGTGVATRRIRSGQSIKVDGDAGAVTLLDGADGEGGGSPDVASKPGGPSKARRWAVVLVLNAVVAIGVAAWWRKRKCG